MGRATRRSLQVEYKENLGLPGLNSIRSSAVIEIEPACLTEQARREERVVYFFFRRRARSARSLVS